MEPAMDLSTVIVLVLGLIFFGGIIFLAWREQGKGRSRETADAARVHPGDSKVEEKAWRGRRGR
jgi:hypothetical protein